MAKLGLAFTRRALAEYENIAAFSIDRFGEAVADAYMSGLDVACEMLCEFPEMAAADDRIRPPTRVLTYRSHRILYHVERDRILVVAILHHAQATPPAL